MTNNRGPARLVAIIILGLSLVACGESVRTTLTTAQRNEADGDYRTALIHLKNLLRDHPDNGRAWLLLGRASLWLGSPADAQAALDKAAKHGVAQSELAVPLARTLLVSGKAQALLDRIKPETASSTGDRAEVLVLRGNAYLAIDKPDKAEDSFNEALKLSPRFGDALVGLANVALAREDVAAANKQLERAWRINPDDPRAWMVKGRMSFSQHDYPAAEKAFSRALEPEHSPLLPQARFMTRAAMAEAQIRQQKYAAAIDNLQQLNQAAPDQPYANYLRALVAYKQNHYGLAEAKLQQVLKVEPDNTSAQMLLGAVNYARGQYSQAEMRLSTVIGLEPDNVNARKLMALSLYKEGQSQQAVEVLRPAVKGKYSNAQLLALISKAGGNKLAGNKPGALPFTPQPSSTADTQTLQTAQQYIAAGKTHAALELLRSKPASGGVDYDRERLIIVAYLQDGDSDKALAEARKLVRDHADAAPAHMLMAGALLATGDKGKARAQLEKAHKLAPTNIPVMLNLASLATTAGDYDRATRYYRQTLDQQPKSTDAMLGLAKVEAERGHPGKALEWVKKARTADPKALAPQMTLVRYYTARGKLDQALDAARQAAKIAPDNAQVLNTLGIAQLNGGDRGAAIRSLTRAVAAAPDSAVFRTNLARAQIISGNFDGAGTNLQAVVDRHPAFTPGVALYALLKVHDNKLDDAVALARTLHTDDGHRSVESYALEGDLCLLGKRYDQAAAAYAQALNLHKSRPLVIKELTAAGAAGKANADEAVLQWLDDHPDDMAMRAALGNYYLGINRNDDAMKQYQAVIGRYPHNVAVLNNLAWLYSLKRDPKAVEYAQTAHKLAPKSAAVTDTWGWALLRTGRTQAAVDALRQAVAQAPKALDGRYHLAVALVKTGNRNEARDLLAKLLASNDQFRSRDAAQKLYAKLK